MKQFQVYLSIVACVIISAKADKEENNWKPISVSCKKYQNLQTYNIQKCEKRILWGPGLFCNIKCDKAGAVIISECHLNSNNVDYPLCNDLYCAAGKAGQTNEGSALDETTTAQANEETTKPLDETTTAQANEETTKPLDETTTAQANEETTKFLDETTTQKASTVPEETTSAITEFPSSQKTTQSPE